MRTEKTARQLHRRVQLKGTAIVHDSMRIDVFTIANVSEGGVFLTKGKPESFATGRSVTLMLRTEGLSAPLQVQGTIVRLQKHSPAGLAIRFGKMSHANREGLCRSIQEILVESALNGKRNYVE